MFPCVCTAVLDIMLSLFTCTRLTSDHMIHDVGKLVNCFHEHIRGCVCLRKICLESDRHNVESLLVAGSSLSKRRENYIPHTSRFKPLRRGSAIENNFLAFHAFKLTPGNSASFRRLQSYAELRSHSDSFVP